jgi:hypothetical protein
VPFLTSPERRCRRQMTGAYRRTELVSSVGLRSAEPHRPDKYIEFRSYKPAIGRRVANFVLSSNPRWHSGVTGQYKLRTQR